MKGLEFTVLGALQGEGVRVQSSWLGPNRFRIRLESFRVYQWHFFHSSAAPQAAKHNNNPVSTYPHIYNAVPRPGVAVKTFQKTTTASAETQRAWHQQHTRRLPTPTQNYSHTQGDHRHRCHYRHSHLSNNHHHQLYQHLGCLLLAKKLLTVVFFFIAIITILTRLYITSYRSWQVGYPPPRKVMLQRDPYWNINLGS